MSSDSSGDEDLDKLREAADSNFINDAMFDKKLTKEKKHSKNKPPPSLRRRKDEDEQFNSVRVSPEFRSYVAKHLTNMLDEVLEKSLFYSHDDHIRPKQKKGGIKLLRDSPHFIKIKSKVRVPKQSNSPANSDDEDYDKFQSVVVNPSDILSKKETKSWSNRSKAPVYTYLKTKDGLVLK